MIGSANLNIMIKAARKAGRSLVKDFREVENLQVSRKGAGDFVSKADIAAEKVIKEELMGARPTYGWLAEEGGEEDEEEEEEEEEAESMDDIPDEQIKMADIEDKFFMHNENLRSKYNQVELDSFMKLLNVKPTPQWEDDTTHHYKIGIHVYEDDSQHLDPYFHLLAEVERKAAEKQ